MANDLTKNPMTVDTAATLWSADNKYVQLVQWIDDGADLTDDDDIVLVINGATITGKIQIANNTMNNLVAWEMKFNPPFRIESFVVTTLDHGLLVIWLA